MEEYLISMGISIVLKSLKNETTRRKFENAFLKIRDAINAAFAGNPKFQQ